MPATAKVQVGDWYDYPQYFDMIFRDETETEVDFILAAAEKYCQGKPLSTKQLRFYEPGCGSGRLVVALASLGHAVLGSDLNRRSLSYLRSKLRRRKLDATAVLGDMTTYVTPEPVDVAFCTFNTFRHLMTEESAVQHLQSVAKSLRSGGIYILGYHIIPLDADEFCIERWRASHGRTSVSMELKVLECHRDQRAEQVRISVLAKGPNRTLRCRTEFPMRLYTVDETKALFAQVPELELVGIHDFCYEIDEPLEMNDDLEDSIFILRRRR